jgi:hypothetical protein
LPNQAANAAATVAEPNEDPEETETEETEQPFEKAVNPGPGLTFRLRKATDDEKQAHLDGDATRKVAVVVNHNAADKLAAAIESGF